jgi:hypothetical protein
MINGVPTVKLSVVNVGYNVRSNRFPTVRSETIEAVVEVDKADVFIYLKTINDLILEKI